MGTSGSEGGQQKPTSRKTGRALLSDPYTYARTWTAPNPVSHAEKQINSGVEEV
jgi:hypothetical protein